MNLKPLEDRLYPSLLTIPIEFSQFYSASFNTQMAQDAIDQYVPEYTNELYAAVKRYVLHGNSIMFLKDENLDILVNKVRSEFELLMWEQKPSKEMVYQVLMFMVEKK